MEADSMRRLLVMLLGMALPVLNRKLGLDIPPEQVVGMLTLAGGYVLQSAARSMHSAQVEAAAQVKTNADVLALLEEMKKKAAEVKQ